MRLSWSARAVADLVEIGTYVSHERPAAAGALLTRFRDRVRRLREMPRMGRVVPEWEREDLRELIEAGFRIVYRVGADEIEVVTVYDGHRRFPAAPELFVHDK